MFGKLWYAAGLQFTCNQCGNCCTGPSGFVWVSDQEALAIAAHFGISLEQFRDRYMRRVGGRWSLNEKPAPAPGPGSNPGSNASGQGNHEESWDCTFLARDESGKALCTIYGVRPGQCRTWPFWPENLRSEADWKRAALRSPACAGMKAGMEGKGEYYPIEKIGILRERTPRL